MQQFQGAPKDSQTGYFTSREGELKKPVVAAAGVGLTVGPNGEILGDSAACSFFAADNAARYRRGTGGRPPYGDYRIDQESGLWRKRRRTYR